MEHLRKFYDASRSAAYWSLPASIVSEACAPSGAVDADQRAQSHHEVTVGVNRGTEFPPGTNELGKFHHELTTSETWKSWFL